MKYVFFGTPQFAATVLKHLLGKKEHELVAIVSKPDKPQGRQQKIVPTPVKVVRDQMAPHVPLLQPLKASDPEFVEQLKSFNADLFVVVAYGEIVKKTVLDIPKICCLNIHASLLPLYRGAAPMQRCLLDGVSRTGITIMRMDVGLDSGDILLKKECPVPFDMTLGALTDALQEISCRAIDESFQLIDSGKAVFTPQDHSLATFAPKVSKEEAEINWDEKAINLHNKVRAFSPSPGAWSYLSIRGEKKRLKILETSVSSDASAPIGKLIELQSQLAVGTKEGVLIIKKLQLEGKSPMDSSQFLKGYPLKDLS